MSESDISVDLENLDLFRDEHDGDNRERPDINDCDSFFALPSINFDTAYPSDIFRIGRKNKPPSTTFYEDLKDLRDTDRVFVKQATKPMIRYIDTKCQFEVLNSHGLPIYFALDTTDAWANTFFAETKLFNVMVLDYDYSEVLKITGPGINKIHGSVWVKHQGRDVGRIVQEDHMCSFTPVYNVKGPNEVVGLKAKGPLNAYAIGFPNNPTFEIYLPEDDKDDILGDRGSFHSQVVRPPVGHSLMAKVRKQWLLFGKYRSEGLPEDTYVVDFHQNMDLRTKCIILSMVFLLDYQFYHKKVESGLTKKAWAWFIFIFFALVLLLMAAITQIRRYRLSLNSNSSSSSNPSIIPNDEDDDDFSFNSSIFNDNNKKAGGTDIFV